MTDSVAPVSWPEILERSSRAHLAALLLDYAKPRRWFRAKGRTPRGARIADLVPLDGTTILAILEIDNGAGAAAAHYALPLTPIDGQEVAGLAAATRAGGADEAAAPPQPIVAPLLGSGGANGALVDGLMVPGAAAEAFLRIVRDGLTVTGEGNGQVRGEATVQFSKVVDQDLPPATIPRVEQTNSVAIFGDRVLLKIYRQLTPGPNPELEMGRFLNADDQISFAPRVLGALSYRAPDGTELSLGIAHEFVPNQGDAFSVVVALLRAAMERSTTAAGITATAADGRQVPALHAAGAATLLDRALDGGVAASVGAASSAGEAGEFASRAAVLGKRTGELHLALAGGGGSAGALAESDPRAGIDFAPEPLTATDRARLVERAEAMLDEQLQALVAARPRLDSTARQLVDGLTNDSARRAIRDKLVAFRQRDLQVVKTRTHGDLHLGQVLVRGDDFLIIDFEGEPARPLAERRAKSSPLRDVMGMIRSFGYAPEVVLRDPSFLGGDANGRQRTRPWAERWKAEVSAAYLRGYLATVGRAPFIPATHDELRLMLTFFELEKVIYEIAYELNNRPDWVGIPLRGLAAIAVERGTP